MLYTGMLVRMPWSQTDVMKERVKFVLEWERRWKETHGGRVDIAELLRLRTLRTPDGLMRLVGDVVQR